MAIDQESFNTDLYRLLRTRGYKPVPKDAKNQRTQPEDAEVFNFTFTKDGKDYGDAWVTIDEASNVVLYYSNEQEESPSGKSSGLDYDDSWSGLKRHLKQWSMNKQLTFELRNKDELGDDMAQRDYVKKKEKMNEGYHSMGKKASYNDNIPAVKIILQHNRQIEEGEQRYRNIAKIFLENQDGERFLAPTTRPGIAQVYARHIAEGGVPNDERWNHVKALCEEYSKMAGFVRATKNKQFMESAQQLVSEGVNHYQSLRETLGKLRGHRGYNMYFESWTPALMEDDTGGDIVSKINDFLDKSDIGNDPHYASWLRNIIKNPNISVMKKEIIDFADELNSSSDRQQLKSIVANSDNTINELFVQETVDPRIESVMPILARLNKNKATTTVKEVSELAEWADKIVEQGVAEGSCDVEEDLDNKTIYPNARVIKTKKGRKVGEIYPLEYEDGSWGCFHYNADRGYEGMDSEKEALEALRDMNEELSARGTRDMSEGIEKVDESYIVKKLKDPDTYAVFNKYVDKSRYFATSKGTKEEAEAFLAKLKAQHKDGDWRKAKTNLKQDQVEEDLDADQKRVGQLGPTEKVGKEGAVGKLVGACESVEDKESEAEKKWKFSNMDYDEAVKKYGKDNVKKGPKNKLGEPTIEILSKLDEGQEDLDFIKKLIK